MAWDLMTAAAAPLLVPGDVVSFAVVPAVMPFACLLAFAMAAAEASAGSAAVGMSAGLVLHVTDGGLASDLRPGLLPVMAEGVVDEGAVVNARVAVHAVGLAAAAAATNSVMIVVEGSAVAADVDSMD